MLDIQQNIEFKISNAFSSQNMVNQDQIPKKITLNNYTEIKLRNTGSFGIVYSAINSDNLKVAIKVTRNSIQRELSFLNKSKHPNIIEFKEYFYNHIYAIHCLIFECARYDLFDFLSYYCIVNMEVLKSLFFQILDANIYLKNNNMFHMDLKLENIVLTFNPLTKSGNCLKLIDFGNAKYLGDPVLPFEPTPMVCPPEYFNKKVDYEKFTVWTIGMIFYELYESCCPFDGEFDICTKDLKFYTEANTTLDYNIQNMINQCLIKDFTKRCNLKTLNFNFMTLENEISQI
jgi:serine/threonine protein kinase